MSVLSVCLIVSPPSFLNTHINIKQQITQKHLLWKLRHTHTHTHTHKHTHTETDATTFKHYGIPNTNARTHQYIQKHQTHWYKNTKHTHIHTHIWNNKKRLNVYNQNQTDRQTRKTDRQTHKQEHPLHINYGLPKTNTNTHIHTRMSISLSAGWLKFAIRYRPLIILIVFCQLLGTITVKFTDIVS